MKRIIKTYYAVCYMPHKNSKHADDFGYFWFSVILMAGESIEILILAVLLTLYGLLKFTAWILV